MTTKWTDAALLAARKDGDPEADALVERILTARAGSGGVSRGGYNHLLDLADVLRRAPGTGARPVVAAAARAGRVRRGDGVLRTDGGARLGRRGEAEARCRVVAHRLDSRHRRALRVEPARVFT